MKLYNSVTRKLEELVPVSSDELKLYTCGPTVYNHAHIGNLRTYIFEDVLEKTLVYLGYRVNRVMNITDVGHLASDADTGRDKLLIGAERENKSVLEVAKFYTEAFKKDFESLNLKWPDIVVPATQCIDVYIKMITTLLEKGYAYISGGNVYFDVSKLEYYNSFNNQQRKDLDVGVRDTVNSDSRKKNQQDFVLWFTKSKFENQELKWSSPWGVGYPGWHIECSGISYKYLGDYLDIHCGGVDNKFPHHANEIAQSEAFFGKKWCSMWFHVEHLNLIGDKMSKSAGNFLTINDLKDRGYMAEVYKLFCLQSHYRRIQNFSFENLESAKNTYDSLTRKISELKSVGKKTDTGKIQFFDKKFRDAISNDLNTSLAIATVFDVLKSDMDDDSKIDLVRTFDSVLALSFNRALTKDKNEDRHIDDRLSSLVREKITLRDIAKRNRNYALADSIRDELEELGVMLIDTSDGTQFRFKNK